jgi:hypothetical protein
MISTVKILSILEAAQIEVPKARAIAESIELAFRENEDVQSKRLMTKEDGARLETQLIKWMFGLLVSQAVVVLGGVWFMLSHAP